MAVRIHDPVAKVGIKPIVNLPVSKLVWTYLPILILLVGLGATITQVSQRQQLFSRASGGVTLTLVPSASEVAVGEEFTVSIYMDPTESMPTHAYLALSFSPEELEIVDPGQTHTRLTLPQPPMAENLAEVTFRALKPVNQSEIDVSSETWVAGEDNQNLIRRSNGVFIKIQ